MSNPPDSIQAAFVGEEGKRSAKIELRLMSTSHCHLCDQAKAMCESILNPDFFILTVVDIAESDDLVERFGVRIPVLCKVEDHSELGWPFDPEQIIEFLS